LANLDLVKNLILIFFATFRNTKEFVESLIYQHKQQNSLKGDKLDIARKKKRTKVIKRRQSNLASNKKLVWSKLMISDANNNSYSN